MVSPQTLGSHSLIWNPQSASGFYLTVEKLLHCFAESIKEEEVSTAYSSIQLKLGIDAIIINIYCLTMYFLGFQSITLSSKLQGIITKKS